MRTIHDNSHMKGHPHGIARYACPDCGKAWSFAALRGPRVPPHKDESGNPCEGTGLDLVRAKEKT